jgi:hypothetical protein
VGKLSGKAQVLITVAVTALLCASGMYLILTSSGQKQNVYVTVSSNIEGEMTEFFAEFERYTNAKVQISVMSDPASLSFSSNTDVVMTTSDVHPGIAAYGIDTDDIEEWTMVTPGGTPIHIFYKKNAQGMAGTLVNWVFSHKLDIRITVFSGLKDIMMPFFNEFEAHTNAKIQTTAISGSPQLSFNGDADVIVASNISANGIGKMPMMTSAGAAYVYYMNDAQGITKLLIDWLYGQRPEIRVLVSDGHRDHVNGLLEGLETDMNVNMQISAVTDVEPLSFSGNTVMIVTTRNVNASDLVAEGVTEADIKKMTYLLPAGTLAYVFFRNDLQELTDPLTEKIESKKQDLRIVSSESLANKMGSLLEEFKRYSDMNIIMVVPDGPPPDIAQPWTADVVITVYTPAVPVGVVRMHIMTPGDDQVDVYFRTDANGVTRLFIDWLSQWETETSDSG